MIGRIGEPECKNWPDYALTTIAAFGLPYPGYACWISLLVPFGARQASCIFPQCFGTQSGRTPDRDAHPSEISDAIEQSDSAMMPDGVFQLAIPSWCSGGRTA